MTLDLGITRRQRYVSDKTAANVTSSNYAQGGTITSYTYSGTTYIAHIFTSSGIFTVTSDIYPLDFIAVAGGGGGGNSAGSNAAGGGGGGGIVSSGLLTTINRVYPSSAYIAVTTSTQANVSGGWLANSVFSDFSGGTGGFHFVWNAIQQTAGGARTTVIPEQGADNVQIPSQFYMEIGITGIGPADVAVALIRDGYPKDGFANMQYLNLNGGAAVGWAGAVTALGTFVAGDTLQLAWDAQYQDGRGTYWWAGKNNTWAAGPFNYTNYALTTGTYLANGLRVIFMSAASGGGNVRGQFRSGNENIYPTPSNGNALGILATTITNYTGYYTTPLGSNYVSSGTTYGVIIGAGGGVNSSSPTAQQGAPGSNGGDTVIYNPINPSFYYSTYFSNSYITATNAAFAFGTGDFTIETWLYPTASYGKYNPAYNIHPIFSSRNFINPDAADRGFIVYLDWYNKVTIQTSGTTYINTVNTVTNGVWSHLAVSRTNNIFGVWINGVKDSNNFFTSTNFTNNSIMIGYGSNNNDLTQPTFFTGYFSNYRMVKGLSVYNPGFQGLTAPLTATQLANVKGTPSTAIAGTLTSLLMLTTSTSGIFYDSSLGTTATLTNINIVTASGLGPGTYSGSLSFNGATQYLTSATSTAFTFGTSDFTVEYWVYYNATNNTFQHTVGNGLSSGYGFGLNVNFLYMTTGATGYQTTFVIRPLQWLHIAWARSGTTINVYCNGNWVYAFFNMVDNISEVGFSIGARPTPQFYTNGYLSNIRVVKGVALYTNPGTFIPPTTISSATQSTSTNFTINAITTQTVLLTFNSATIVDLSTLSNVLTQTSGTVSISTFAPFNTSTVLIRAFGGGGGGAPLYGNGQIGGSGGGAPGLGNGGASIPGQGNRGGQGSQSLGSGGGGFAYPGGPAVNEGTWPIYTPNGQSPAGYGGAGGYFNHSGAMVAYSGGGGGGSWASVAYGVGLGGVGGGGNGGYYNITSNALIAATAGTRNLGGGGGGSNISVSNAAAGGSGIVIFRYPAFLGDAARFPTDLTDTNLKNTTLLLSSNRTPASLTPVYASTASSSAFTVDYLIVGGGGGGGGASTSTVTGGGGGGGAGGVVSAVGYTPPSTFNTMFYADVAYANGSAVYSATVGGWVNAGTDFASSSASGYNWQYDNRGFSTLNAAKTTPLSESTKYYFEIYCGASVTGPYSGQTGNRALLIGLLRNSQSYTTGWTGMYLFNGYVQVNDVQTGLQTAAYVAGDILNIAYDPVNNKQWFGRNGVWQTNSVPGVDAGWDISGTGSIVLGFCNESTNSASMQGVIRKSTANTYTAPTGFVPYTSAIILTSSTWTITVGSGGAGGTSGAIPTSGSSGANSSISFSNTNFIAYGGGGGGAPIISTSTSTIGSLSFNSASLQNLTVGTTSDFAFLHNGTQDYTLECWFFTNSTAYQGIMGTASNTGNVGFTIETGSGGPGVGAIWAIWQKGVVSQNIALTTAGSQFSTNVWNHLAMTFNATSKFVYMFINGQRTSPASADISTWAFSSANSTYPLNIGYGTSGSAYFSGYITNVRITKSIVYTGIFAVPTSPLTATQYANPFGGSNTQAIPSGTHLLLTVNSATSYITDSSTNNFSVSNTTSVTYNSSSPPLIVSNYPGGSGASGGGGSYNLGGGTTVSGQGNVGAPTGAMVLAASQSLSFNGSSQYLTAPSNAVFAFGTGDFTVESWFYTTTSANQGLWDGRLSTISTTGFAVYLTNATNTLRVIFNNTDLFTTSQAVILNRWNHIAFTRLSGTVTLYLNGSVMTGGSGSAAATATDTNMWIGRLQDAGYFYNGYISNFRVVKGLAVYTGNFNVPTLLLQTTQTANPYGGSNVQAISTASYTSLLLTSLTDSSTYGATITNNGSVAGVGSYPPINRFTYPGGGGGGAGSTGLWTANTSTGGSGGVGTYTSIMSTSTALAAGVGQVVGNLVYFAGGGSGAGNSINAASFGGGGGSGSLSFNGTSQALSVANNAAFAFGSGDLTVECWFYQTSFGATSLTLLSLYHAGPGRAWILYTTTAGAVAVTLSASGLSGGTISLNTWNHVAWTRNGANFYLYLNGIQIATVAASTIIASTDPLFIGANNDATSPTWFFPGYISNVRIVKGTAVYTTNFTVPTSPLTNIANTQLLLLVNNDTNKTVDSSNNNFSITNVNGVTYNSSSPVAFVTATNYTGGGGSGAIYGSTSTAGAGGSGVVVIRYPNAQPDATITPNSSAIYINTSGYKTYIFTATGTISFATSATYSTVNYIAGYTSGTPITNNRTISDSSYNNIVINTATTTLAQGTFSPYGSMWSTSFNGSTDYLAFTSTGTAFAQNSFWGANKSFTIEAWLNPNGFQTSNTTTVIMGDASPIGSGLAWSVGLDAQLKPMMYWRDIINGNNSITATNSISTGTWNHVAWVSNAGTPTIYINGLNQIVTTSTISTLTNSTQTFGIVVGSYFNKFYNGSISNLRASTSVLYLPDSRGSGASAYFNGTNYLSIAGSISSNIITGWGPITIEAWVWPTSTINQHIFSSAQQVNLPSSANIIPFQLSTFNGTPNDGGWYIGFASWNGTAWNNLLTTTTPLNINTWQHIAAVLSGETTKIVSLYLNGVLIGSKSYAGSGWTIGGSSNNLSYIGARWDSAALFTGYISNVRIVNTGTIYTTNFTPPALDLTNVSGTQLLTLLTTNTTVKDNSANSYVITQVNGPTNNPLVGGFAPFTSTTYTSFTPSVLPFNASGNPVLLTCNTYRHIDISTASISINTGTVTSTPRIQRYSPYSMGYAYNPLTIGGSVLFNGSSDFVYTTTATDVNFISTATSLQFDSDFTIECWIYTTSTAVAQTIFDTAGKEGNTLRPNAFSLNMSTSGQLYFNYNNVTSASSNVPVLTFTWAHIAVTRFSGIMQIWQNGVQTLGVNTTTNYSTGQMLIGRNGPTATAYFNGFISDFRTVKGTAIYTNTFNPPVAPLKPIDSTTSTGLLLNFNNVAIADATMNHNVIVVNSATISSSVTKYNPRSIFFPGVAEYLTVVPNSISSYALGTSDFTVEMWTYILPQTGWVGVNNLQPATNRALFDMRTTNTANNGFDIYLSNTGTLNVSTLNAIYIAGTTFVSVNNWHHIALVKKSTSFNLYLNGIPEGLNTSTYITNFINPTVRIGFGVQTGYFNGYIDDVRITRGVARYSYPGFLVPQKSLPVK